MKIMMRIVFAACLFFCTLNAQEIPLINLQATSEAALPVLESEIFHLINQHRVANLLQPLRWASTAAHLARKHSLNMADGSVPFGHEGANLRLNELRMKIPSLGNFGENVAYNSGYPNPAEAAVEAWLNSPGHYANIMGDFNLGGVGVAKNLQGEYYFTHIFVRANIALLNSLEGNEDDLCVENQAEVSNNPIQINVKTQLAPLNSGPDLISQLI